MFSIVSMNSTIEVNGPRIYHTFDIFGFKFNLTEAIVVQWVVILLILFIILYLTKNLKVDADTKRQAIAEKIVITFQNLIKNTMDERYSPLRVYIATIFSFSMISSLMPMIGLRAPTTNLMVTLGWALLTFIMIFINKIRTGGIKGYVSSLFQPFPVMLPLNIIGDIAVPVALSLRHFANLVAGLIISQLIAFGLGALSSAVGLPFELFRIGIPAILSLYFDIFSAVMQAFVFCMLTMVYIYNADLSAD